MTKQLKNTNLRTGQMRDEPNPLVRIDIYRRGDNHYDTRVSYRVGTPDRASEHNDFRRESMLEAIEGVLDYVNKHIRPTFELVRTDGTVQPELFDDEDSSTKR